MSYEICCELIRFLNIRKGDKVLHLGCGSGDVSKFISGLVGSHGKVVAVDLHKDNITEAEERFKDINNLTFSVGDLTVSFPHENEQYYDLILSCNAFRALQGKRKTIFVEKAYQSLTNGGRFSVMAETVEEPESEMNDTTNMEQAVTGSDSTITKESQSESTMVKMLRKKPGEKVFSVSHFKTFEEFDRPISTKLLKNKRSSFGKEFREWLTEFQGKCKETEENGKLKLEFKELVRVRGES